MEKENVFQCPPPLGWAASGVQLAPEMGCGLPPGQPRPCFLNLNGDCPVDQSVQLESALSSIVSSPSNPPPPPADSVVIRELIGRLGSICNSGEVSPLSHRYMRWGSTGDGASCYSTPLNSPSKVSLSTVDHHQAGGSLGLQGNPLRRSSHLTPFAAEPGFAERAIRFSCFGGGSYDGLGGQFGLQETGSMSRASSSQSLSVKASGSPKCVPENMEIPLQEGSQFEADMMSKFSARPTRSSTTSDNVESGGAREGSPVTEQVMNGVESGLRGPSESNSRKRKAVPKGKAKDIPLAPSAGDPPKVEEDESNGKRSKSGDTNGSKDSVKPKVEQKSNSSSVDSGQKPGKENSSKKPEPPKQDYIHVRARRGQATDSHSLAERVRREKISQRMKFLQDLVPGCSKVTGKAVMLDEIINYVQSLQRQVEFLSMKLAAVNPQADLNVEHLLRKDMHQPCGSLPHSVYPPEASTSAFPYITQQHQQGASLQHILTNGLENQCSLAPLDVADATLRRIQNVQLSSIDGFANTSTQVGSLWEDDLRTVVEMGFGQIPETIFSSQSLHGSSTTSNMKIEL